jgi:hypothetical protein
MKTFEVWSLASNPKLGYAPLHILEAASFDNKDGVFTFYDEALTPIHSIVATPGMLIRKIGPKWWTMTEDKEKIQRRLTVDSLTTEHLELHLESRAATLTVSHLDEKLATESLTTPQLKQGLNHPGMLQAQTQNENSQNAELAKQQESGKRR